VVVRDGGHLVMLEHPAVVTAHLEELVLRAARSRDQISARRRTGVPRPGAPGHTVTAVRHSRRRDSCG
jgi:hypothetical protein